MSNRKGQLGCFSCTMTSCPRTLSLSLSLHRNFEFWYTQPKCLRTAKHEQPVAQYGELSAGKAALDCLCILIWAVARSRGAVTRSAPLQPWALLSRSVIAEALICFHLPSTWIVSEEKWKLEFLKFPIKIFDNFYYLGNSKFKCRRFGEDFSVKESDRIGRRESPLAAFEPLEADWNERVPLESSAS